MKISIITATYNSASTMASCMQSVLNQTYVNLEYLIMDGGSTDKTLEIIDGVSKQYPKANVQLASESDHGIYDALNKGIDKATGDVIGIVHSDDLLAHNRILEKIATIFQAQNADGVYGNLHYVKTLDTSKVVRNWKSRPFKANLLKKGWMPAHPTLFLKREVYLKEDGFNTNFKIASDYDLILRIFKNADYKWHFLPEVIIRMRLGGTSNRSLKNIFRKSFEDYQAIKANDITNFPIWVLLSKNLSKISQFFT